MPIEIVGDKLLCDLSTEFRFGLARLSAAFRLRRALPLANGSASSTTGARAFRSGELFGFRASELEKNDFVYDEKETISHRRRRRNDAIQSMGTIPITGRSAAAPYRRARRAAIGAVAAPAKKSIGGGGGNGATPTHLPEQ